MTKDPDSKDWSITEIQDYDSVANGKEIAETNTEADTSEDEEQPADEETPAEEENAEEAQGASQWDCWVRTQNSCSVDDHATDSIFYSYLII